MVISLGVMRRDPLGTDISKYNFSSPGDTLRSVNAMVARQDLRAAGSYGKVHFKASQTPI